MNICFALLLLLRALSTLLLSVVITGGIVQARSATEDLASNESSGLQVTELTLSEKNVKVGEVILLKATIVNCADYAIHNLRITVSSTTSSIEVVSASHIAPITILDKGEAVNFEAELKIQKSGKFKVGVVAMAENAFLPPSGIEIEVVPESPAASSNVNLFAILGPILAMTGVLSYGLLRKKRYRLIWQGACSSIRWAGSGLNLHPKEILLALGVFVALCFVFFIPYAFSAGGLYESSEWIVRVYFPLRIVIPVTILVWYGLQRHNYWLAFLVGSCPLFVLALTELSWKPFQVILVEDIYYGVALGLFGLSGGLYRHQRWLAVCTAIVGMAMFLGGGAAEGILRYVRDFL